jgi:hypothetical protein
MAMGSTTWAIGAPAADPGARFNSGETCVICVGGTRPIRQLSREYRARGLLPENGGDGSVGSLNGISGKDTSGSALSAAGDVNADGIDDLLIGASRGDPNALLDAGESYVVLGRHSGQ